MGQLGSRTTHGRPLCESITMMRPSSRLVAVEGVAVCGHGPSLTRTLYSSPARRSRAEGSRQEGSPMTRTQRQPTKS